jgi:recombination protein RecA
MATNVLDVLKKLNKDKAEEDKVKVASSYPDEYFVRKTISTGSPYLDYRIKRDAGKGGLVKGSFNLLIGGEGSGKTSIALLAAANEQRDTGNFVVFYDGEGSMNDSYLDRFGLNKDLLIYHKGRNLEDMLDYIEAMSLADNVGMIIIDSIPIFVSSVVEEKSAEDNTIGVEAKKFTARMAIIEGNCSRRNICLTALTFYTLNPGTIGDPRVLKRGEWQKYMSNLTLEFTKKDLIKDENGHPIGHVIDVRTKKSKLQEYDAKDAFQLNFYYQYGFNKYDEYTSIFIEEGIISQGGAWFSFADDDGVEVKLNGKSKVIAHLKENEDHFQSLLKRVGR